MLTLPPPVDPPDGTEVSSPAVLPSQTPSAQGQHPPRRRYFDTQRSKAVWVRRNTKKRTDREQEWLEVDPLQIRARTFGELQWICPRCGCFNLHARPNWRKGRIACKVCAKAYAVGIMFWASSIPPPFNALLATEPPARMANRLRVPPQGTPLLARFGGSVQWECAPCRTWHGRGTYPDWQTGIVTCATCGAWWAVAPILWPPKAGRVAKSPRDWSPPETTHVAHWIEDTDTTVGTILARNRLRYRTARRRGGAAGDPAAADAGGGGTAAPGGGE